MLHLLLIMHTYIYILCLLILMRTLILKIMLKLILILYTSIFTNLTRILKLILYYIKCILFQELLSLSMRDLKVKKSYLEAAWHPFCDFPTGGHLKNSSRPLPVAIEQIRSSCGRRGSVMA